MKLLVAIDLSEPSEKIVQKAQQLANALTAKVWLMHVADPDPEFIGWDVGPQSVRDNVAEELRDEHRQIQELADDLRKAGLDATALLVQGSAVDTILEQAAKLHVDMIILGSHGRGAAYRLLVGSVSEGVLRKSDCPVLIVPTHPAL